MAKRSIDDLGRRQLAVMEAIWGLGEASVHDVRKRLGTKRPLAYTTVLSTLQKLEKAGWLRHRAVGRTYLYRATETRAAAGSHSLRSLLALAFGGNPVLMLESLLDSTGLSKGDLERLHEMIAARKKERNSE